MSNKHLINLHFLVEWGGSSLAFSEVSGLGMETEVVEFRSGSSREYSSVKMPGRIKYPNIVLKRGMTEGDNEFFEWWNTIQLNRVEKRDVVISLLNENHEPAFVWRVRNAFPAKLYWDPMLGRGNAVFIETLELAHEGLIVQATG